MNTLDISQIPPEQLRLFGHNLLYLNKDAFHSFEDAAQYCTNAAYDTFCKPDGSRAFALVRIFRATRREQLPPELQKSVTTPYALALMASSGDEPQWNSRKTSVNRRAIPIDKGMSPMFQGIFYDLGFSWEGYSEDTVPKYAEDSDSVTRLFHVEDVSQSSYITDQAQFVQPYGIKSVIALGSRFLDGSAYVMIGFTRITVNDKTASMVSNFAPYLSALLAIYDARGVLWNKPE